MPPPINIEEYLDRSMMGWRPLVLCPAGWAGLRAVGIGVGRLRRTTSGSGAKCKRPIVRWG